MQRWKPGASSATHLLVAALLWSFIGIYLLARGVLLYDGPWWPVPLALAAGAGKAHWLLAPAAARNITRILALQENSCLGAVYSLKMWGLVVLMMLAGRFLREFGMAEQVVALAYLMVGCALFLASRLYWQQWRP
ncbi:MAG: hypothetical protein U5J62_09785 [Desulfurivibrio sp.]|nr:hypothetical protein [Desulfurivibrio sp.]